MSNVQFSIFSAQFFTIFHFTFYIFMQVRLSVFYNNAFLSYQISSEDKVRFHFELKSAPRGFQSPPDNFYVVHKGKDQWDFEQDMDKAFQESVAATMKKTKL